MKQLNGSPAKQDLKPSKIDLSQIAVDHPVNRQVAVLDLNTFDATQLTLLEVLDMAEIAGVQPELLGTLLSGKSTKKRMVMMYAMAWCIAKRANASLTYEEVCTWKLEVIGEVSEEQMADRVSRSKMRAEKIVGAASVSGLPQSEAANLTVAELGAYADRQAKVNRAARRHGTR